MQDHFLTQQDLAELKAAHRAARNAPEVYRLPYRLNAAILLGTGWRASAVAAALSMDDDTVRNHFRRDKQGDITARHDR